MRRAAIALGVAFLSCGAPPRATETHAALSGEIAARVGAIAIPTSLVARVAGVRAISPREALDRLVDDALAAQGAAENGLDRAPRLAWGARAILARAAVDRIVAASRATPPTEAEIADASAERWREVDLPPQVRVVHAVVRRPSAKTSADDAAGRALAGRIAAAVASAADANDFEARASGVPHDGFEVVVQPLPSFVADGRTAEGPPGSTDPTFASAAFALSPGATSGVVETPFGWHVIRLLARLPAHVASPAERVDRLRDGIFAYRARTALDAIFSAPREVQPDALALLASVHVDAAPGEPPAETP